MLTPGTILQNRYRIVRQVGGGGMGTVYLAEDLRLPGRRCAVKEMSPAFLSPHDQSWAVPAFQREAHLLASLNHPNLAAVTDFFPEGGNWYLVMEFVEGETLARRLERSPGHRLPLPEALPIIRQLCDVLEYLHTRQPPVIFRDLKPSNIMLTPEGRVKLIDFGIARFFKPGQRQDTVNLGTPGYAAPEQYGGLGQSDPRTDIYSLGVLLHQMVTGYDPAAAAVPFPLPPPRSLMPGIPPEVERVILRATQIQPDARYPTIQALRDDLFPPTQVIPPRRTPTLRYPAVAPDISAPTAPPRQRTGLWIGVGAAAIMLLAVCIIALIGVGLSRPTWITRGPATSVPAAGGVTPQATTGISPTPGGELTPTPAPAATPSPSPPSAPFHNLHWSSIGQSVQRRDISMAEIGYEGDTAIVVVGSIQGDQMNTRDLVQAMITELEGEPQQIPQGVMLYLIPSLNPDGNAANSRYNAHGVDLNRNWETTDWRPDAAVPGYPQGKPGSGGQYPFSEPETRALRDLLLQIRSRFPYLRVIVLHSSMRRSRGEVYPGGDSSMPLAEAYARAAGYDIESAWAEYTTSGELITWCDENRINSIDVVIPGSQTPFTQVPGTSHTLCELTLTAIWEITIRR
jgi:serine/threonine-protein kinase